MYDVLSVIALVLSLTGNILINYKKRIGYIVWILSNVAWIAVNVTGQFNVPMVIMYVVYMILNIQGFLLWSKDNKKNS